MGKMKEYEVEPLRVIIAGGGTAGHINPGIAIAKYIKQKDNSADILFIGTKRGMETTLVPREGFELKLIKVKGFRRKLSVDTLISIKELLQGIAEARSVIKQFKPDVVIGTGGYVCGPVVFNASMMKIPTLIHEQNAFPGVTNRILSRFVDAAAISFKESEQYFKSARRLVYTGNPVRSEIIHANRQAAREKLGVKPDRQFVVVFGGSLGAGKINDTVVEMLKKHNADYNLLFGTGNSQHEEIKNKLKHINLPTVNIEPYIYNMGDAMAAADLIICRAGAITCAELTALGIPSIMIPSPNVVANHQEHNARSLERQGASVVILEKDLNPELLYRQITDLLNDREQLNKMSRNARKIGIVNSAQKIYSIIQELV
jgi:UDP-N-acetylglucosamine--N-acetylmuramyl-(pentapeptide) pyrophosphoryl-undecaprenol N-acetylglucosamine transferase